MSVDTNTLMQILNEALATNMQSAIDQYGASLSDEEKKDLLDLTHDQILSAHQNLVEANKNLGKLLWFDNNNNNT